MRFFSIVRGAASVALALSLFAGPRTSSADCGCGTPEVLAGRVYCDLQCDGMDIGEPGVAGVRVTVIRTDAIAPTLFTMTDTDGAWAIELPSPGVYQAFVDPNAAPLTGRLSTPSYRNAVVGEGQVVAGITFGACGICGCHTGCEVNSSITSEFNGTGIRAGNFLWFNSHVSVNNRPAGPVTVFIENAKITSGAFTLALPSGQIVYSPTATVATTTFSGGSWVTTVPATRNDNVFMTGFAWQLPANLPGGLKNVVFSATFRSDTPGLNYSWQWSAAAYFNLGTDPNSLGVKPADGSGSLYNNSDHVGTPETFKKFVTGGARGGGGSEFTGSWSGTGHATCK
jgi:hypothetical protein